MSNNYRPQPTSDQPTSPKRPPFGRGRYLTAARRSALYTVAPPTEQLPRGLPPATLAGQLRVLELQRDNLNRAIAQLRVQQNLANS